MRHSRKPSASGQRKRRTHRLEGHHSFCQATDRVRRDTLFFMIFYQRKLLLQVRSNIACCHFSQPFFFFLLFRVLSIKTKWRPLRLKVQNCSPAPFQMQSVTSTWTESTLATMNRLLISMAGRAQLKTSKTVQSEYQGDSLLPIDLFSFFFSFLSNNWLDLKNMAEATWPHPAHSISASLIHDCLK